MKVLAAPTVPLCGLQLASPVLAADGVTPSGHVTADAIAKATDSAAASGPGDPRIDRSQSCKITCGGAAVGSFLSGSGEFSNDAGAKTATCFAAFVPTEGRVSVVPTIGKGDWEAETCESVKAISTLPASGGTARIGVLYQASSPNAEPIEPVVFDLGGGSGVLAVDTQATRKASLAGITTVGKLRNLTP